MLFIKLFIDGRKNNHVSNCYEATKLKKMVKFHVPTVGSFSLAQSHIHSYKFPLANLTHENLLNMALCSMLCHPIMLKPIDMGKS